MLSLYHAPDLETLGELATTLLAQPLADPFAPARVVVPSQGMGRWLTLELARRQGIAMQLELQLPAAFVWDLSRTVLGSLPEQSAFSPTTLTWRLYGWLCEPANLELAPRLAQYLYGGDERRRLSLAAKIADVFDQYLLYRDDWLAAWERGETLDLGPDEAWQALLWRELTRTATRTARACSATCCSASIATSRCRTSPSACWCSVSAACRRTICACSTAWHGIST